MDDDEYVDSADSPDSGEDSHDVNMDDNEDEASEGDDDDDSYRESDNDNEEDADEEEADQVEDSMDVDEETGSPRLVHGTRKMATMEQLTQLDSIMEFESRLGRGRRDESVFKLLMQRESGAHSGASDYHPGARVPSSSGSGDMTSLSADQPNTSEGAASPTAARQHQDFCCSPFASIAKSHIGSRYLPRRGRVLAEYADNVFCGQFSESGELFMSASQDNRIRIYDAGTWQLKKTIVAQDVGWSVLSVDYSPDQQWVIYSSWSDYVHMANTSGEHEVHEALHMKPDGDRFCLFSVVFSPDSKEILGGSSDLCLYIYDLERRERIHRILAHQDDVNAVAFADASAQVIFSGSDDYTCKVWDRRAFGNSKLGCVGTLYGHTEGLTFIDSRKDSRYLITNSKDHSIKIWDLRKLGDVTSKEQNKSEDPNAPSTAPARRGYRSSLFRAASRYHRARGEPDTSLHTYRGHRNFSTLIRSRFSPVASTGQRYIYSGSYDGSAYIWDVQSGEMVGQLAGHTATVRDVHWHPDQPTLMTSSWDCSVMQWSYHPDGPFAPRRRELRVRRTGV